MSDQTPAVRRTQTGMIATTHLDLHNERLALSALEGMAEQISEHYITAMVNHDPRYPPYGRVVDATVVPLGDGDFGLQVTTELFDGEPGASPDGRTIVVDVEQTSTFRVRYDRSVVADDPGDGDVAALAAVSGADAEERGKKALEPVAELVLQVGLLAAASIAAGFFAKVGADAWDAIKRIVAERYTRRKLPELFEFSIGLDIGHPCELLMIVEQPDLASLERLFSDPFVFDVDVEVVLSREPQLARLVYLWRRDRFALLYAVRTDGVPVLVDWDRVPPLPEIESK